LFLLFHVAAIISTETTDSSRGPNNSINFILNSGFVQLKVRKMRGSNFGKMLSMTTFGESHGKAMGVVLDGIPSNLEISEDELKKRLASRAPGILTGTSSRKEPDLPIILSGIFEGKTLGTPIAVIVENLDQKSSDYDQLKNEFRKGHADQTTIDKYGIRDHRGGGRASGRETVARVIAGYFASLLIKSTSVDSYAVSIGDLQFTKSEKRSPYGVPLDREEETKNYLTELQKKGDSVGGRICIEIHHIQKGLGEPVFDKLKADFAKALLSIGAVTSFSYEGGIEGGISNGEEIKLYVDIKPTSTTGEKATKGRHDPCIVPRVIPVAKAMIEFVIADHYLRQQAYKEFV